MRLKLGTRGSRLAMAQATIARDRLAATDPSLRIEVIEIQTSGDRIHDAPLGPELGQGFFTKEIEDALVARRIDLAVHSCKDLAATLPAGLVLAAITEREDPRDALVSAGGEGIRTLPPGTRVGTSSPRRRLFLEEVRPDLELADIRGNVPTRVAAVDEGRYGAVVLAAAGLRRLGLDARIAEVLDADDMLPAAGQGALGLEVREDDEVVRRLAAALDDAAARCEVTAERSCLRRLGAGCQAPVGAFGRVRGTELRFRAAIATPSGIERVDLRSTSDRAEELGTAAAEALLDRVGMLSLRGSPQAGGATVPGRMR
jgi:hydroxymethylbilane synthase